MTSGSRQPVVKRTPIVIEQLITPVIQTDSGTGPVDTRAEVAPTLAGASRRNRMEPFRTAHRENGSPINPCRRRTDERHWQALKGSALWGRADKPTSSRPRDLPSDSQLTIDEYRRKGPMPVEGAIAHLPGIEMYGNSSGNRRRRPFRVHKFSAAL
jgi:hypothetical protein